MQHGRHVTLWILQLHDKPVTYFLTMEKEEFFKLYIRA